MQINTIDTDDTDNTIAEKMEEPIFYELCKKNDNKAIKYIEGSTYVDADDYTALMYAYSNNMHYVALKLLDFECVPQQINAFSNTVLILACTQKMSDIALKMSNIILKMSRT